MSCVYIHVYFISGWTGEKEPSLVVIAWKWENMYILFYSLCTYIYTLIYLFAEFCKVDSGNLFLALAGDTFKFNYSCFSWMIGNNDTWEIYKNRSVPSFGEVLHLMMQFRNVNLVEFFQKVVWMSRKMCKIPSWYVNEAGFSLYGWV